MKIDTHQHYWRYRAAEFPWIEESMPDLRKDCMPIDCEYAMRAAGVDGVVAVQARTLVDETDFLLKVADNHPEVLGVVGWADLAAPNLEAHLERWTAHPAMRGIRHILQDESDVIAWLHNPRNAEGLRSVQRAGLVYDVLVFDHQLPGVASFCAKHDGHWLVLDHLGKPSVRDWQANPEVPSRWLSNIRSLATLPHVVCKLSGLVTETDWKSGNGISPTDGKIMWTCFDQALEAFGPHRLMFGSDWPVCQLAAPYEAVHGLVQKWAKARLTMTEQEAFWSGNAIRCYGLNVHSEA
ncbi:COG3618 Predicted metal-dependent hydrolase of the TIM-barrel fold [Comamonadaceae bacterium]